MFLDILLLFVILLTVLLVVTAISHIWVKVPFIPTPKHVVKDMLSFAELRGDETIYDLGAGDARLLIEAKRMYPSLSAVGVELIPTVWLFGKMRIWFSRQKVEFLLHDALTQNVSDADCIFLYLIPSVMKKLEQKFTRELKPGTKVVSYAFQFPTKKPLKEMSVPWLTGERKLRMYEW